MRGISKSLLGLAGGMAALALMAGVPSVNAASINNCLALSTTTDCKVALDVANIAPTLGAFVTGDIKIDLGDRP
jgi:hypothetical protein